MKKKSATRDTLKIRWSCGLCMSMVKEKEKEPGNGEKVEKEPGSSRGPPWDG